MDDIVAEVSTIAGLVLAHHGAVPEVGATVGGTGCELTVEDVEGHEIVRVRVIPPGR